MTSLYKNTASQKIYVFAWDTTTGVAKTGDAANLTAYIDKDHGGLAALTDTSATELDSTNAKGYYVFDISQTETNADKILITCKSSTANIAVIGAPAIIDTRPATGWLAPTTAGRTLDVSAGGEAGVDWANVGSQSTSVNLSGTTTNLVNTVTTYTGNTPQTGDSFARIGATGSGLTSLATQASVNTIDGIVDDILLDTAEIGTAGAGLTAINLPDQTMNITGNITGNLSGSVGSVTGAVGSVSGLTASDVGAIKTKTDQLTFTVPNQVDANAESMNATAILGNGSAGNLWRG